MMKFTSIFLFWVAFAAATASTYVASDDCTDRANTSVLAGMDLILYPNNTVDVNVTVCVTDALDLIDYIDSSKPTILYIFGWTESSKCTSVDTILSAYCKDESHNVLLLDWETIASENYYYAALSVNGVGYTAAMGLNDLVASGLDPTGIRIVGHSLGAQIAGCIGRYVNFTLPRITGLDPAGPSFTVDDDHLSSSDAEFVEIIHTNPGVAGIDYNTGHADFWPNNGSSIQPGCENESILEAWSCSHARSWHYYIEAFLDETAFFGIACESESLFEAGSCSGNATVAMGYATPIDTRGNFDLQTNSASPYGRGAIGTTYYAIS